jgi:hypothetical protein
MALSSGCRTQSVESLRHSERLRAKIQMARSRLDAAAVALWTHEHLDRIYPEYLRANHAIVRASVPLMEAARNCACTRHAADPVSNGLTAYLSHHIPEETGHDEWVLDDLETIGFDRRAIAACQPTSTQASLVGAQYYWIFHHHPVALLGYIAVLEGTPPTLYQVEQAVERTHLSLDAFSNMTKHARLDPRHRDELNDALDQLPLTAEHASLVSVSAFHTIDLLSRVVEELLRRHQRT